MLSLSLLAGCKSSTSASGTGLATTTQTPAAGSVTGSSSATSCPTSDTTGFAKTKFVLHTGLAFGAFHRYLYKPFKAGTFQSGAHGRISALVKAGLAALFVKREVRLASEDVKANPTLCKMIAAPLRKVGDKISSAPLDGREQVLEPMRPRVHRRGLRSLAAGSGATCSFAANRSCGARHGGC